MEHPNCLICNEGEESIEHMLLGCGWTRGVWYECCYGLRVNREEVSRFDNWWM